METKKHLICEIQKNSIAEELGFESGDELVSINGIAINDIFDYQYMIQEEYIEVTIRDKKGEEWLFEIEKEPEEDLGITFQNGLMDEYRSCRNQCIFCFIDQMPKGMRETLYFKDDDSRLSFLQGNYVTLTNMSEEDVDRIIKYRLSPINISFHTTNPELRCKMLHNRFAGEALKKADRLYEAEIMMNGQIVLCKGVNDGEELRSSIEDLSRYLPYLESISVVPVGLSRHREGLFPLEPFTKEDAREVILTIKQFQASLFEQYGLHFVHASDEWYVLAEEALPEEESYDGYLQLENGVGMLRLLLNEFKEALDQKKGQKRSDQWGTKREISMATGQLAYPFLLKLTEELMQYDPGLSVKVYPIVNHFFGERITVSGLLTGQDLLAQLKGRPLGDRLLLPQNVLRSQEAVFLDDMTVDQLERALQVKIDIVKSSGRDLIDAVLLD